MKIVLELPNDCNPGFPYALKDLADLVRRTASKRDRHGDFTDNEMDVAKATSQVDTPPPRPDGAVFREDPP